ncbi:alkaline shock protein [Paucilactobacillus oligofermentans DSM 15707 = LMG 22743]|uniref:Alkaline shock protein n=1 Tax=Paucilactobacillus oligofermentans DSM 15707 = LMG 22743 TaxID=1423778 RepID=A0A0R1REB0_9LACO|nr:Asp23/Gls24 family envelope stress response protein [Paucilactobacillus oligofermentans]KRL54929.1 alkaline shock protein [Paucilactobacillus oligofermentans DSM 15707 = LMG 22743]CUS26156.1 Alkaline shock protein [Paucilactobacillus oligofermentans DSM 15707 = LMG 22743]
MAEETNLILNQEDQSLGSIEISPSVLETVAGIAANQIEGVSKMHGSITSNVTELLGRHTDHARGVKLTRDENELVVDVDVYLEYGVNVPKTAIEIQDKVKQQVSLMTDLKIQEVNVHIEGMVPEKSEQKVDPNDIFAENENGE